MMPFEIVELDVADLYELRRRVLRTGTTSTSVAFDGDELPGTFHLAARTTRAGAPRVLAISTWVARRYPDRPAHAATQLRGMATDPARRSQGLGSMLLAEGLGRCATRGDELVWARARDEALGFYLRHGFEVIGRGYVDLATGLPHHDIVVELSR